MVTCGVEVSWLLIDRWGSSMSIVATRNAIVDRYTRAFRTSERLYRRALGCFPDGVTHDLRHLQPFPVYIERGEGSRKWDVDGHEFVDWWSGHGSIMLGHSHPKVVAAV